MHGVSMAYSFDDPGAADRHQTQYFETPWVVTGHGVAFDDDVRELYDKLHELQRLFLIEAARYNVLPLDDRFVETHDPEIASRPVLVTGTSQLLFPGMRSLNEDCVLNIGNKSHAITAQLLIPDGGASGVLSAQGGVTGGWSLYLKDGRPKYHYNFANLEHYEVDAETAIPAGDHQLRLEFAYDGGGLGKGGTASLSRSGVVCLVTPRLAGCALWNDGGHDRRDLHRRIPDADARNAPGTGADHSGVVDLANGRRCRDDLGATSVANATLGGRDGLGAVDPGRARPGRDRPVRPAAAPGRPA
jgi:hypothetical protein